jgi:DNA ligase (NAD+)
MSESPQKRIAQLTDELNHHSYQYYVLASPEISDREFDALLKELESLEEAYPQWALPDSPTNRVGGQITKEFETVQHKVRMMSLANTYSKEELEDFDRRVRGGLGEDFEYTCELKYDGFAISLWYEEGVLVRAITRGDGVQGDDVTTNVKTIRKIPHRLKEPVTIEARGEIFMHKKAFAQLNEEREKQGLTPFANPRNSAAGTIKMQEADEVAKRPLDCFMYQLVEDRPSVRTHYEGLKKLEELGLPVHNALSTCRDFEAVWSFITQWDKDRKNLSFETDGVVVKVNQYRQQEELGATAKAPRWAIAYKFETEQAFTRLNSVSYQVGRTGAVTPVANLEPVLLLGTTVKRASLHNADIIAQLGICEGDMVVVEKGGEIIPKIVDVVEDERPEDAQPVKFIEDCPICSTRLIRKEGEAAHICPNSEGCPPQIKGRIEHFISRKALDIDSLGEGKIEILYDNDLVHSPADLYSLTEEQLLGIGKTIIDEETGKERFLSFKEKTVENTLKGIEASREKPFHKVLYALGIRYVGETVSKKLAEHFQNINALQEASFEDLVAVREIGDKIAESVRTYFQNEKNQEEVARLISAGLNFVQEVKETSSDALEGKKFVVSGVFERYSRNEIKALIEDHGGKNVGSLSGATDYLLAGENMGPAKRAKAEKLNVPIIDEATFISMIGDE